MTNPPTSAATATPAPITDPAKATQVAYHDWEASTYDEKFSISYDERCITYAAARWDKVSDLPVRGDILELGGGTGFFTLNLALAGRIGSRMTISDLSPEMLAVAERNAEANGITVHTRVADAERLPFDDETFDVVLGHAFLHHLPVPELALREAFRVLRPGGMILFAGEPTQWGDRIAGVAKRATAAAVKLATARGPLAKLRRTHADRAEEDRALAALEHIVDLHTFDPDELGRRAEVLGFTDVRIATEELTASWVGWSARTLEAMLRPGTLPAGWHHASYRTWRALMALDERVLTRMLPKEVAYNVILSATKPR